MYFKTLISYILMILPVVKTHSKIQINVQTASNKADSVVTRFGVDNKLVTGKEIDVFNISDSNLKRGFRVELGKRPDDVFLKDPTTYGNLFEKYKWMQLRRSVRVKKAEVTEIVNENITMKTHIIVNNTPRTIKKKIGLIEDVEHSISSSWSADGLADDEIFYNINVTFGKDSFRYENKWRNKSFQTASFPFGISYTGDVIIKPGQAIAVELNAVKAIVLVKIDYSAKMTGNVIGNYAKLYGKYHFWAPAVENIMKAAKLRNEIVTTEFLEIRCYVDPSLKVIDNNTRMPVKVIKNIPFYVKKRKTKSIL